MGWNGRTLRIGNGGISVSYKDCVTEGRLDQFEKELDERISELIADEIRKNWELEIEVGEVIFAV